MDKSKLIQIGVYSGIAIISGLLIRGAKSKEGQYKLMLIRDSHFRSEIYTLKEELDHVTSADVDRLYQIFNDLKAIVSRYIEYTEGNAEYIQNILYDYEKKLDKTKKYTGKILLIRKAFNRILE